MRKFFLSAAIGLAAITAANKPVLAHGPLFSPAPETIFKGGTEVTLGLHTEEATGAGDRDTEYELAVEAEYGITADWEVGIELPYTRKEDSNSDANGIGDITLSTKYQFWSLDLPGSQYKAAALLNVNLPTGDDGGAPRLGSGSTDVIAGIATGYESRRWYWFASGVYRANTEGAGNLEKGDRQFLNLVGGIRPVLTDYKEPDTVLMLELNWENAGRDDLGGAAVANTGGWELFLSPVVWWTYRQVAVRGGVQIPVASCLNGNQPSTDYRTRIEFIYHL